MVVDAAFFGQAFCNVFLEVFSVLHADDELVVRVQVGSDLLGNGRAAAIDLKFLVPGAGDWFGQAGFANWLWWLTEGWLAGCSETAGKNYPT